MESIRKIELTLEEKKYRDRLFAGDTGNILNCDITCTVCSGKLNWMIFSKKQVLMHPHFEVLLCEGCLIAQATSEWPGVCAWCGVNRDNLIHCTKCPISFCENCIRVNFGLRGVIKAKLELEWECYLCDSQRMWVQRAVCHAAKNMVQEITKADRIRRENESNDCAICLEEFENINYLSCEHAFHKECLEKSMETTRSCPVCHSSYLALQTYEFK